MDQDELDDLAVDDDGEDHTVTLTISGLSGQGAMKLSHAIFVLAEATGTQQAHGQSDGKQDLVIIENGRTIEDELVNAVERIAALLTNPVGN